VPSTGNTCPSSWFAQLSLPTNRRWDLCCLACIQSRHQSNPFLSSVGIFRVYLLEAFGIGNMLRTSSRRWRTMRIVCNWFRWLACFECPPVHCKATHPEPKQIHFLWCDFPPETIFEMARWRPILRSVQRWTPQQYSTQVLDSSVLSSSREDAGIALV
jgi:hypothetical protein